ncbi:TRAP transporter small permease [Microvirga pudoricolor]|uniref:TRAP transporter small permease n=1 Tax=Microvirga pudoricolor TaxID=2778729 RepID=UPI001952007E|nr:TRAP transporter small permease [Microvirga pudoricolor]MBM6596705.1 TRAP transporter small permease [Microvirga pudoricolor]
MTTLAGGSLTMRLIAPIRRAVDTAVILLYSYMVLAVVVQVAGRYIPGLHTGNAVETSTYAQVWLTAVGASVALRHGAIFAVDTLTRHLNLAMARVFSILIAVINMAFIVVMIYGGILLTEQGFHQTSPVLLIPMWTIFISIPIGMILLGIEIVMQVFEKWGGPFEGHQEELL